MKTYSSRAQKQNQDFVGPLYRSSLLYNENWPMIYSPWSHPRCIWMSFRWITVILINTLTLATISVKL